MAAQERNRLPRRAENHRFGHQGPAQPHDQPALQRIATQPALAPHGGQAGRGGSHRLHLCTQHQGARRPHCQTEPTQGNPESGA